MHRIGVSWNCWNSAMAALLSLALTMLAPSALAASDIIGYYRFENSSAANLAAPGQSMQLLNTSYANGGVYLNGIFELDSSKPGGFRAITEPLGLLNYSSYAFIVEFNTDKSGVSMPVLVQGTIYRSLQLMVSNGQLQLTLNNMKVSYPLPGTPIVANRWYKVALAFDLLNKTIRYAVDGGAPQAITLPTDFTLEIFGSVLASADKLFAFSNYGSKTAFSGYVKNLVIFNRALSSAEVAQYSKTLPDPPFTPLVAPVCTLSASSATVVAGATVSLTACCSPAASSLNWSCDKTCTFSSGSTTAQNCSVSSVSPTATTIYAVVGSNAAGSGSPARVTVSVAADSTPPGAPANLTARVGSANQIDLSWNAATDNVGVTAYRVYRPGVVCITTPCPEPILLATLGNVTSYSTSFAQESSASFYVVACDAAGNCSPPSNTVTVTPQLLPPVCTLTATPASINPGESSTLSVSCSPMASAYVWSGGSCAGNTGATCTVTPAASTSYSVVGSNASGAGNSVQATVTVKAVPPVCTLSAAPASLSPGGSSTLTASCTPAASTYTWSGGSCAGNTGATCVVKPAVTTTYAVVGNNAAGAGNIARVTVTPFAVQAVVANNIVQAQITYNSADNDRTGSVYIYGYLPANSPLLGTPGTTAVTGDDKAGPTLVFAVLTASGWHQVFSGGGFDPAYSGTLNSSNSAFALYVAGLFDQFKDAGIICVAYTTATGGNVTDQGLPVVVGNDPSVSCPTVNLTAPAYHGLWWNANESGWGLSITQHASTIFAAIYHYDPSGQALWYAMSSCPIVVNGCTGEIYQVRGGTPPNVPWNGTGRIVGSVGSGTLNFSDANNATLSYTINGVAGTKNISRNVFATGSTPPAVDYTDLWWNTGESGWGVALTQEYATIFAAWYTYDALGNPVWYVASNCPVVGSGCTGDLYRVSGGSPLTAAWKGTGLVITPVGNVAMAFSDARNGRMNYTIDGVAGSRAITRLEF